MVQRLEMPGKWLHILDGRIEHGPPLPSPRLQRNANLITQER